MNEDNKKYQIVMVFPPTLESKELEQEISKVKQIITGYQGTFSEEKATEPQLKRLSYPINKYEEAFYSTLNFSLSPQEMEEVNKQLNLEDILIRFVITVYDKTEDKPEQAVNYSKMVEKIEPVLKTKEETPQKKKTSKKSSSKAEIEDLDKKLEEILND